MTKDKPKTALELYNLSVRDDPRMMAIRYQELCRCRDYCSRQLYHVMQKMPHPGFKLDLDTGQFEPMPISPEWQNKIDHIVNESHKYLSKTFPEFYPTKQP